MRDATVTVAGAPPTMHSPSTLAGKAHGTPNLDWKCRHHGLVAPSAAGQRHAAQTCATNLRPLSLVFTPYFSLSRLTRYRERRAAPSFCSISDKFIPPERRSSAVWRPRTGLGTGQVWILHGAAVYLRAHGAFRGVPEACRLRGAAIARRRRLCQLTVTPSTRSQCVCSASTPATVTPSVLAYTG